MTSVTVRRIKTPAGTRQFPRRSSTAIHSRCSPSICPSRILVACFPHCVHLHRRRGIAYKTDPLSRQSRLRWCSAWAHCELLREASSSATQRQTKSFLLSGSYLPVLLGREKGKRRIKIGKGPVVWQLLGPGHFCWAILRSLNNYSLSASRPTKILKIQTRRCFSCRKRPDKSIKICCPANSTVSKSLPGPCLRVSLRKHTGNRPRQAFSDCCRAKYLLVQKWFSLLPDPLSRGQNYSQRSSLSGSPVRYDLTRPITTRSIDNNRERASAHSALQP